MSKDKLDELAAQIEEIKSNIFLCSEWIDELLEKVEGLIEKTRRI